jgi:phage major head subunit gpT-like protein
MPSGYIDTNPGLAASQNRGVQSIFFTALLGNPDDTWRGIAIDGRQSSKTEIFNLISEMPGMKQWIKNRRTDGFSLQAFAIEALPYEATLEIDEFDLRWDKIGAYNLIAQQMGAAAARTPAELVFGLLEAGFTTNGYDGTTFFSTSHAFGSNRVTTALGEASLQAGILALRTYKSENGQLLNLSQTLALVYPPALAPVAEELVLQRFRADGTVNPNFGKVTLLESPTLTDANNWYLIGSSGPIKPIIFTTAQDIRYRISDAQLFDKHIFHHGVDAMWGRGYALPQMAYGAIVT